MKQATAHALAFEDRALASGKNVNQLLQISGQRGVSRSGTRKFVA
jgi:hypothetical protein